MLSCNTRSKRRDKSSDLTHTSHYAARMLPPEVVYCLWIIPLRQIAVAYLSIFVLSSSHPQIAYSRAAAQDRSWCTQAAHRAQHGSEHLGRLDLLPCWLAGISVPREDRGESSRNDVEERERAETTQDRSRLCGPPPPPFPFIPLFSHRTVSLVAPHVARSWRMYARIRVNIYVYGTHDTNGITELLAVCRAPVRS